jgi:hypothetical protein
LKTNIVIAATAIFLVGCETQNSHKPLQSYPEWVAYRDCLYARAQAYAPQQGSPLELGTIAASACEGTRLLGLQAISKNESRYFVKGVADGSSQTGPKLAAEMILRIRSSK